MIAALSGMGADAWLFAPLRRLVPGLRPLPWLAPAAEDDLPRYAARYVPLLRPRPETWLVGVSFGGLVAQAIARLTPVAGIVLAGSCRNPADLLPGAQALARLGARLPLACWRLGPAVMPPALLRLAGVREDPLRRLLAAQARRADPEWLRWCCRAIVAWHPEPPPPCPIWQIHGRVDGIMPLSRQQPDQILTGAGHLLVATHAHVVATALNRRIHAARA